MTAPERIWISPAADPRFPEDQLWFSDPGSEYEYVPAARLTEAEAALAEMTRRRDEWRARAEGFDAVRAALREKVGGDGALTWSRVLSAGIAADEKKRADAAEAEVARLRAELADLKTRGLALVAEMEDRVLANAPADQRDRLRAKLAGKA